MCTYLFLSLPFSSYLFLSLSFSSLNPFFLFVFVGCFATPATPFCHTEQTFEFFGKKTTKKKICKILLQIFFKIFSFFHFSNSNSNSKSKSREGKGRVLLRNTHPVIPKNMFSDRNKPSFHAISSLVHFQVSIDSNFGVFTLFS